MLVGAHDNVVVVVVVCLFVLEYYLFPATLHSSA